MSVEKEHKASGGRQLCAKDALLVGEGSLHGRREVWPHPTEHPNHHEHVDQRHHHEDGEELLVHGCKEKMPLNNDLACAINYLKRLNNNLMN